MENVPKYGDKAFGKRKDFQGNTDIVRELCRLLTHRRLVKYLSYKQMIRFMSGLKVLTQVTSLLIACTWLK